MDSFWQNAIGNSVLLVCGVCLCSLLLGLSLAYALERIELPGSRLLGQVLPSAYSIPSFLLAMCWIILANPSVGWLNDILPFHLNIYTLYGMIFVESSALFAIVYLTSKTALSQMDQSLEEAGRLAGASAWQVFWKIQFPQMKLSLMGSCIAVALSTLASFGVPSMLGAPGRKFLITTGIYSMIKQGDSSSFEQALHISYGLAGVSVLLILISRYFERNSRHLLASSKTSRAKKNNIKAWKWPLSLGLYFIAFLFVLLPLGALILASFQNEAGHLDFSDLSTRAWVSVFTELPEFRHSLFNSVLTSLLTFALLSVFATAYSLLLWQAKRQSKQKHILRLQQIENFASFFYSLPGTVLALLFLLFNSHMSSFFSISDTLSILIAAYCFKYFFLSLKTMAPATLFVHPSLIEAAQLAGSNRWQRLLSIWLPLLRPALLSLFVLIVSPCFAELTMSVLLHGPGTENLGVLLFQLHDYADRAGAAVLGTLIVFTLGILQFITHRIQSHATTTH